MAKATADDIRDQWIPGLSGDERTTLLSFGDSVSIGKDEVLILQGQQQDTLYLLLSGELRAQAASHRSQVMLGRILPGESVGEMSIIDPLKASATIKAMKKSTLWKIERADFDRLIHEHPEAGTKILRHLAVTMARRVRRACEHIVHQADAAYYDWD